MYENGNERLGEINYNNTNINITNIFHTFPCQINTGCHTETTDIPIPRYIVYNL